MTLPIPSGMYSDLMNGYYGNLNAAEQQAIWDNFAQYQGISATTPDTTQLQIRFAEYLKALYAKQATSEITTALSPSEYQSRLIMFNTVNSITNMLSSLQDTIAVQSGVLQFYGAWHQEYTKMLTRVPVYIANPNSAVVVNTQDLTKFTLGSYANISLSDVIQYGIKQASSSPFYPLTPPPDPVHVGFPLTFGDPIPSDGSTSPVAGVYPTLGTFSFQVIAPAAGQLAIQMTYQRNAAGAETAQNPNYNNINLPPIAPITSTMLISSTNPSDTVYSTYDSQVQQATNLWKTMMSDPAIMQNLNGVTGIIARLGATDSQTTSDRAEVNAKLQQYVENIRSRRDQVSQLASIMQSNLSHSRDGLNQQTNLMTSIVESIDNIMKAIFQ